MDVEVVGILDVGGVAETSGGEGCGVTFIVGRGVFLFEFLLRFQWLGEDVDDIVQGGLCVDGWRRTFLERFSRSRVLVCKSAI